MNVSRKKSFCLVAESCLSSIEMVRGPVVSTAGRHSSCRERAGKNPRGEESRDLRRARTLGRSDVIKGSIVAGLGARVDGARKQA